MKDSSSPFTKHQRLAFRLANLLSQLVETRELGEVFIAPLDVFLNDINVYQPDIVFVSAANLNKVTEKGIDGAPDLCVEVLSQSTQRFDRTTKKKIFSQVGLKHYWLVDPETKSISLFDLTQNVEDPAEVLAPPQKLRPVIFDGLEIDLARLFRSL